MFRCVVDMRCVAVVSYCEWQNRVKMQLSSTFKIILCQLNLQCAGNNGNDTGSRTQRCHDTDTLSALLAIWVGTPSFIDGFPSWMVSNGELWWFRCFSMYKLLTTKSYWLWSETPWHLFDTRILTIRLILLLRDNLGIFSPITQARDFALVSIWYNMLSKNIKTVFNAARKSKTMSSLMMTFYIYCRIKLWYVRVTLSIDVVFYK